MNLTHHACSLHQRFKIDVWEEKIVQWMAILNQSFTEMESAELRDAFCYAQPLLQGKIMSADTIKCKMEACCIQKTAEVKYYLKVSDSVKILLHHPWYTNGLLAWHRAWGSSRVLWRVRNGGRLVWRAIWRSLLSRLLLLSARSWSHSRLQRRLTRRTCT